MSEPYWEPLAAAPNIATLPDRLGTVGQLLTSNDFNTAVSDGWYWNNLSAANAPGSGLFGLHVVVTANNPTYVRQFAYDYNSPAAYWRQSVSGVWSAWFALIDTGGHVPQATSGTGSAGAGSKFLADDQTYKTVSGGGGGGMVLIADTVLGADTATFTFSSIGGYKHLKLIVSARTDRAAAGEDLLLMQFNADTTAGHYFSQRELSNATTVSAAEFLGSFAGYIGVLAATGAIASAFAVAEITIPDYLGGNLKASFSTGFCPTGTTTTTLDSPRMGMFWNSTAAITGIVLKPGVGSVFKAGSRATLYGLS